MSETRFPEEGQLREDGSGYNFFWKGKPADDCRIHGVGFAINNKIVSQLAEFPVGINKRLMTLHLRLNNNQLATVINVYAPTPDAEEDTKEQFYSELDLVLTTFPKEDTKEQFYSELDLVLTTVPKEDTKEQLYSELDLVLTTFPKEDTKEQFYSELDLVLTIVPKEDTKEQFYSELDLVLTIVPKEDTKEQFYSELDLVLTIVPKEDTKEQFYSELDLVLTIVPKEDTKEQFYSELDLVLTIVPKEDKLILLGDFNARVDSDCRLWNSITGKEGVGKANSNGILLLSKCAEYDLVITNTLLRQRNMSRRHGCTHDPNSGTSWTMSLFAHVTEKTSALHGPCVELLPAQRNIAWFDQS